MKKIITLFVCFFCTLSTLFVYGKEIKKDNQLIPSRKKIKFQRPSKELHLARRSGSSRKTSQTVNSHIVRQTISEHLEAISKICDENTEPSFDKRVENLEVALQELRQTIHQYLKEPYLTEEDAIYLRSIEYNTTREILSFAQPLTGELVRKMELNLGETFLMTYYLYYGINYEVGDGDDDVVPINVEDVRYEWAQRIYKGLSCIKIENPE